MQITHHNSLFIVGWRYALMLFALVGFFCACTEEEEPSGSTPAYGMEAGDAISFVIYSPVSMAKTRAYEPDTDITANYKPTNKDYEFTVGIYKQPAAVGDPLDLKGVATYHMANVAPAEASYEMTSAQPLCWPDNVEPYGFIAKAHDTPLSADQTTEAKLFAQDKLTGFSYVPLIDKVDPDDASTFDRLGSEDTINYYTTRKWKEYNTVLYGTAEGHRDYKSIPIFAHHDRVWITVILKAGKGVRREDLAFAAASNNIVTTISSYTEDAGVVTEKKISPLASEVLIDYDADTNGPAAVGVSSTQYDAIVEPFEYWTHKSNTICNIALSTQKFSFAAQNDTQHSTDEARIDNYNLAAGKHLIITALLQDDRIVLLTALVEDWTETVTTTMVNDFGMLGDPIYIENKGELIDFLKDTKKNVAGNYAIVTNDIDLDAVFTGYETQWTDVTTSRDLHATLNLAGHTITTTSQFLNDIDGGNLLNGAVEVAGSVTTPSTAPSYVAKTNTGKIEQISLSLKEYDNGVKATATASVAGFVETNNKYIFNCSTDVPVYATTGYAGGIAGVSLNTTNTFADIQDCRVASSVKGTDGVTAAGGIVGQANGTLKNNTFDYGITISQDATKFKNVIGAPASEGTLEASGNGWPTTDENTDGGTNATAEADRVNGVIDCQEDLLQSLTKKDSDNHLIYNYTTDNNKRCRIVHDFVLDNTWSDENDIYYQLLGGNKVIETYGKRIFKDIYSNLSDITIHVMADISNTGANNSTTASALANYLKGKTIDNIRVRTANDVYIEAANPGGILYQAEGGATISNCQFNGKLKVHLDTDIGDGRVYAGGIVAKTSGATLTGCVCHSSSDMIVSTGEAEGANVFYGGIVGAVNKDAASTLLITNCTSNFYVSSEADQVRKGAIVGCIKYIESSTEHNVNMAGSTGNWWEYTDDIHDPKHYNIPISTGGRVLATGQTVTDLIGRRNAVKPSLNTNW